MKVFDFNQSHGHAVSASGALTVWRCCFELFSGLASKVALDAVQVVGYFNYVTRVADGVGIEDEPDWPLR